MPAGRRVRCASRDHRHRWTDGRHGGSSGLDRPHPPRAFDAGLPVHQPNRGCPRTGCLLRLSGVGHLPRTRIRPAGSTHGRRAERRRPRSHRRRLGGIPVGLDPEDGAREGCSVPIAGARRRAGGRSGGRRLHLPILRGGFSENSAGRAFRIRLAAERSVARVSVAVAALRRCPDLRMVGRFGRKARPPQRRTQCRGLLCQPFHGGAPRHGPILGLLPQEPRREGPFASGAGRHRAAKNHSMDHRQDRGLRCRFFHHGGGTRGGCQSLENLDTEPQRIREGSPHFPMPSERQKARGLGQS